MPDESLPQTGEVEVREMYYPDGSGRLWKNVTALCPDCPECFDITVGTGDFDAHLSKHRERDDD